MFGNNRKTIGVFVTQEHQDMQKALSRGICMRAQELGYNVAFFTNFLPGNDEYQYEIGERSMADLPLYESFDGIILLPDIWYAEKFLDKVRYNIKKYSKCPVVSVTQRFDEYYNILINENSRMDDIIRHFVEYHGYKKINFITGPESKKESFERLAVYKRVLSENNIEFEEDRIYFGDFWKYSAKDAVKLWLTEPDKWPEAIICANDYMAIAVCNTLAERGITVPDDIAVAGCDNIPLTEDYSPSITTTGMPLFEMGVEAVDKIHCHNQGILQDKYTYKNSVTMIRESCGCKQNHLTELSTRNRNRILNEMDAREKDIFANAFMSIGLTNIKTIDDIKHKLTPYLGVNEGFTKFYMCLYKNWDLFSRENITNYQEIKDLIMEVGIENGVWLPKEEFSRPSLLPDSCIDSKPQIYFFNMLHYQDICFGYTAISFKGFEVYKPSYQGWLINICNALESMRIHNELNCLVYKLEDMYIKDELTDLYNRRALDNLGKNYLKHCIEEKSKLMVFTADLDKLKFINDNYGHASGDVAIKAIADAMKSAAEDDEICMRVGGDEFVVIGMDYDQNKLDKFLHKFEENLENFNTIGGYKFKVHVSCGWSIISPQKDVSLEDCLNVADAKMYQQKLKIH